MVAGGWVTAFAGRGWVGDASGRYLHHPGDVDRLGGGGFIRVAEGRAELRLEVGGVKSARVLGWFYNCAGLGLGGRLGFNRGATGDRCDQRLPAFALR